MTLLRITPHALTLSRPAYASLLTMTIYNMQLRHITDYHSFMRQKGANMRMMAMHKDDGTEYKRGWVVSGYAGYDSHKYFSNNQKATEFIMSRLSKENRI